jgi:hypothetical protein
MKVQTTSEVEITSEHVSAFLEECDIVTLWSLVRQISIDKMALAKLRDFLSDTPAAGKVMDAFEGVADALAEYRAQPATT